MSKARRRQQQPKFSSAKLTRLLQDYWLVLDDSPMFEIIRDVVRHYTSQAPIHLYIPDNCYAEFLSVVPLLIPGSKFYREGEDLPYGTKMVPPLHTRLADFQLLLPWLIMERARELKLVHKLKFIKFEVLFLASFRKLLQFGYDPKDIIDSSLLEAIERFADVIPWRQRFKPIVSEEKIERSPRQKLMDVFSDAPARAEAQSAEDRFFDELVLDLRKMPEPAWTYLGLRQYIRPIELRSNPINERAINLWMNPNDPNQCALPVLCEAIPVTAYLLNIGAVAHQLFELTRAEPDPHFCASPAFFSVRYTEIGDNDFESRWTYVARPPMLELTNSYSRMTKFQYDTPKISPRKIFQEQKLAAQRLLGEKAIESKGGIGASKSAPSQLGPETAIEVQDNRQIAKLSRDSSGTIILDAGSRQAFFLDDTFELNALQIDILMLLDSHPLKSAEWNLIKDWLRDEKNIESTTYPTIRKIFKNNETAFDSLIEKVRNGIYRLRAPLKLLT